MILPNVENSILEIRKLREYCLSLEHPIGKHKALAFKNKLGITSEDSEYLKTKILEAIKENEAQETFEDKHGKRFNVDFEITNFNKTSIVRTIWIIKSNENFPRFVSCYAKN
jgi:Domain of unknown function (DUF6883)